MESIWKAINPMKYATVHNDTKHPVRLQWNTLGGSLVTVRPGKKKPIKCTTLCSVSINLIDEEGKDESAQVTIYANEFHDRTYRMSFEFKDTVAAIAKASEEAAAAQEEATKGWAIFKKKDLTHNEETTSTEIAVDQIVSAVSLTVAAVSTGGVLSPLLATKLKDFVKNAGWSDSMEEDTAREHMFGENDDWLFVEIVRRVSKSSWWAIASRNKVTVHAKTKILYMKAGDNETKATVREMENKEAKDAMDYINKLPGWVQQKEE